MSGKTLRSIMLLMVVLAVVLTSCTTPAAPTPAAPAAEQATAAPAAADQATAAPAEAAPADAAPAASGEKIVLNYWDMDWGDLITAQLQKLVDDYNKANPNVEVKFTKLSWGDYMQKMLSAVAAGNPPDVSGGDSGLPFNFTAQGEALPLDELYAQWKNEGTFDDLTDWGKAKWFYNGHYVGVSWQIDARAIYYRPDMLEQAGVQPPTNHDELLTVAKKLTNKDKEQFGICVPGKAGSYDTDQFFMTLAFQDGAVLADEKGNPTIANPEMEMALKFEKELVDAAAPEGTPGYTFAEISRLYEEGKCAMVFNGGWFIQQLKKEAPDVYAKTKLLAPLKGQGAKAKQHVVGFYNPWMIFKQTKHPAEAMAFLKYMADPKNLKAIYAADLGSKFSPYKSLRNETFWDTEPMAAEFASQVAEFSSDYWWPNNAAAVGLGSMGTGLADYVINPVLTNARTPKEALDDGQAKLAPLFEVKN